MRQRIVIPVITADEVADFPRRSATPADVLAWVESRCSKKMLNSGRPLKQIEDLNGETIYTARSGYMVWLLRAMGFGGGSGQRITKARQICGFIFAARRFLTGEHLLNRAQVRAPNMQPLQMPASINDEHSTSAGHASTSDLPDSLSAQILEQQASLEIKTTLSSNALAVPSPQRALLPSPIFAPPHKRTAQEAALESDDEEQSGAAVDFAKDTGSGRESRPAFHSGTGRILSYPEVDDEEEEYELCEEEDVKHDEEFILSQFDEYEEMTPLEDRRKWGFTPHDDDVEQQHSSNSEHGDDGGYDLDARLDGFLAQGVAGEDTHEDADDEESEDQAETYIRSETSAKGRKSDNRYQDFTGEEIAEDATYYEDVEYMEDEEEGEIHDHPMQPRNRTNRDTLQDFIEEEVAGDDEEFEDIENKENEEQAGKHGGSKMSTKRSKRVKLTETEQPDEPAVADDGREKCAVDGILYDLFAND
ncbi:hypothetical protein DL98DRAFT_526407 [Cadophora sp. DSE1049]|nr:hypothetical protein DL98DRAFT_526407 [Cadophora sp. DSE1049]